MRDSFKLLFNTCHWAI